MLASSMAARCGDADAESVTAVIEDGGRQRAHLRWKSRQAVSHDSDRRRLILPAAEQTQIIVVSHAPQLIEVLTAASMCVRLHLVKELGETTLEGATLFNKPNWVWPAR